MDFKKMSFYAPIILRYGMCFVFFWFGFNQIFNTGNYIGYLPDFLFDSSYANAFVIGNGVIEIILGVLLLLGLFTRVVSLILAVHLFVISVELGFSDTGVRDFGLVVALVSVFLYGPDAWSLDAWRKK